MTMLMTFSKYIILMQLRLTVYCIPSPRNCLDKSYSIQRKHGFRDKIVLKKPSEELLNLIKEIGNLGTRITELFETIKQKGQEEGFTNDEIRDC